MPFIVDEHPVGALGSRGADPPLGITVRPRGPRRGLHYPHAVVGEDRVEDTGELGVTVPDQETEGADRIAEIHEQVAGLLGGPRAIRVGGHAQDVHPPGPHLHDEQHIEAPEKDRVDMEEIAGQQAIGLRAQERPPGGVHFPRSRAAPRGAQDPPHRRLADPVAEPAQFAVHPAVSPGRVFPRQPQHQVADLRAGPRPAWPVRVRPPVCDQLAVPGQQRPRRDEPVGTQHGRKQPGQCRQDRPVGPVRLGPGDLTAEHRDLMTEHQDLRVLGRLAAPKQNQPGKNPDRDQVEQAKRHKPRSCRNRLIGPNRRSQHLRRVLKRYTGADRSRHRIGYGNRAQPSSSLTCL